MSSNKRNLGEKIHLQSFDEMLKVDSLNDTAGNQGEQIKDVALTELHPFKNHPFKVLDG
jgi:ParB family chromosome partitioning protein